MKVINFVGLFCLCFSTFSQNFEILKHEKPINIVPLHQLNSNLRECNLSILPNGNSLFFMSTRQMRGGTIGNGDIYQSEFVNGAWQTPIPLQSVNTTSGEDEPTFSSDGKEMYYQSWAGDWKNTGGPYYLAENREGKWIKSGSMGANINLFFRLASETNFGYGTDGMAVSADGNLFIVACGPNYNGPMDLYYSIKKSDGWTFPALMGVSTEGDERSVFIAADNRTIYFSSDGMGGFGGLDIFKVRIEDNGKLGEPINIGAPFNTAEDDMGFVASADGKSAFFIRNLDIYFADISALTEKIKPITPSLPEPPKDSNPPVNPEPKTITVYFNHDMDQATVEELNKLNGIEPIKSIKIHGYCDADGSQAYNMDLAKRRCESIKSTLISKGITPTLIELVIHGESNPAATNKTKSGKALNRRVELSYE